MDAWSHYDAEQAIHTVVIDAVLQWGDYTLTCPSCHAVHGWSFSTQREPFTPGERAWRICVNGHRSTHPLVYPDMVRRLIEWANAEEPRPELAEVLRDWQPHRMVWRSRAESPELQWHSWHEPAPQDYWATRWPDLLEAERPE